MIFKKMVNIKHLCFSISILLCCSCAKPDGLRVMSYNIRYASAQAGENDWTLRRPATIAMLDDISPDCFGVQEALDCQLDYIVEQVPDYKYVGVGREDGIKRGETAAIFYSASRLELLDWGTYWLSETPDVPSIGWDAACRRTATWALLSQKSTGRKFFYVNTHLDHVGKVARKKGLAMVVRNIADMNPEGYPMILTGDFNVFPDDPCLADLDSMMLNARKTALDSDNMGSFNGWTDRKDVIIDYIYYSGFSSCDNFKVVVKQYCEVPFISDHYPIFADLKF